MPANMSLHIPIVVSANECRMKLSACVEGLQVMSTRFVLRICSKALDQNFAVSRQDGVRVSSHSITPSALPLSIIAIATLWS